MADLSKWKNQIDESIFWLRGIERLAAAVYRGSSNQMRDDQLFSSFLLRMGDDEELHYILLEKVEEALLQTTSLSQLSIKIDGETIRELMAPLEKLRNIAMDQKITRFDVLECIIRTEFSEWNYLFVYIFRVFFGSSKVFQYVAANMEAHRERIMRFIRDLPVALIRGMNIPRLPRIWERRLLIIESNNADREIISQILSRFGKCEEASNAIEALNRIKENFYNVIICGTDLARMNIFEFYKKAITSEPQLSRRFLFCIDELTVQMNDFLKINHLPYLEKPFNIKLLSQMIRSVMEKTL